MTHYSTFTRVSSLDFIYEYNQTANKERKQGQRLVDD